MSTYPKDSYWVKLADIMVMVETVELWAEYCFYIKNNMLVMQLYS